MRNERGLCAHPSRRGRRLAACVSSSDYNHVKFHSYSSRRLVFIRYDLCSKYAGLVSRETLLLADTEIAEDDVQYVLDINSADESSQGMGRHTQLLRYHFFPPARSLADRT